MKKANENEDLFKPVEGSPWPLLESLPGARAVWTVWKHQLGEKYELFRAAFLQAAPEPPVKFVYCIGCGCEHEVVRWADGRVMAECRCKPGRCEAFSIVPEDLAPLELNWSKLGRALCGALQLRSKLAGLGIYNTKQIGCWSAEATPVVLTVLSSQGELFHTVSALVGRLGKPFILFAPRKASVNEIVIFQGLVAAKLRQQ